MVKGHNNPPILVELTPELADFVVKNCDSNLATGLTALQGTSSLTTAEKLVEMIEQFKALKAAVEKARKS